MVFHSDLILEAAVVIGKRTAAFCPQPVSCSRVQARRLGPTALISAHR